MATSVETAIAHQKVLKGEPGARAPSGGQMAKESAHSDKPGYPRVLPISGKTDQENRKAERGHAMTTSCTLVSIKTKHNVTMYIQSTVPGATVRVANTVNSPTESV